LSKQSRVIKDIESLDQAIKAEQDVEAGFHSVIDENISYWMAVEEDVIASYTKLVQKIDNAGVRRTLEHLIGDSKRHRETLEKVSVMLREIMKDEEEHAKMLITAKANLEGSSREH
jgi:bacterioferritin (cytochrome b1)